MSEAKHGGSWMFVIYGRPVVKKNGKQIRKTRDGRRFVASSDSYRDWEHSAVKQLLRHHITDAQRPLPDGEYNAAIVTYLAKGQACDADNLYAGPQDALEKAGILRNDYQIVSHDGSRRLRDPENPRVEITLTRVG